MEKEIYLSLVSEEGFEQLNTIETRAKRNELNLENLVCRLDHAVSELDPGAKFQTGGLQAGEAMIEYSPEGKAEPFYLGEKNLVDKDTEAVSYSIELDLNAASLILNFTPERVKPLPTLSVSEVAKLKEDWEKLTRANKKVHRILAEYAGAHFLNYISPFKFPIEPPEGQEVLPGFADEKEKREEEGEKERGSEEREGEQEVPDGSKKGLSEEIDERDYGDVPF